MPRSFVAATIAAWPAVVAAQASPPAPAADIVVTGRTAGEPGRIATTVPDDAVRDTPATNIADFLRLAPGVAVSQGNGPRDVGVSLRGSNARSSFGARNIQVFEDGFPVTQPDGLARFDLADPHAYAAIDVARGPSSARYGNYALAGALDFHTRSGRELRGLELGAELGSDRYANLHAALGEAGADWDYAVFASVVGGDGATGHSGYRTATVNARASAALGARDRVTAKLIANTGVFRLSTRLSLDQYRANPYQRGCARAADAAPGCGTIAVLANGRNGARIAQTAAEADLARDDDRTILAARWEHDLAPATTWRTQATFDSRVVYQPTSATPFRGSLDSYNLSSDIVRRIGGTVLAAELFFNRLDNRSFSFNKTPAGRDGFGAPTQTVLGHVANMGARARVELAPARDLTLVVAGGAERSVIDVRQTAYAYPLASAATIATVPAERRFWNVAPEAALTWTAGGGASLTARIATGYGIPQATALFVTAAGVPGNNTALRAQRNLGVDLSARVARGTLTAELTGYHEWFHDELVTQSAGVNLLAYTSNVPRSVHRGGEAGLGWRPVAGAALLATASWTDQRYTDFVERLSAGARTALFDRDGNRVPGVVPFVGNLRAGYDHARSGLGGFAEIGRRSGYAIDNANLLHVPAATLVNLNLHYAPPRTRYRLFAAVQNLLDRTVVGSAAVIADSLDPATGRQNGAATLGRVTGSIYAGAPRTVVVGIRGTL